MSEQDDRLSTGDLGQRRVTSVPGGRFHAIGRIRRDVDAAGGHGQTDLIETVGHLGRDLG